MVSYETVRRWVNHSGPKIAADLRNRRPKPLSQNAPSRSVVGDERVACGSRDRLKNLRDLGFSRYSFDNVTTPLRQEGT
jgi:hypothetical protein